MFSRLLSQVPANIDLIVLPEMFSTGFTMRPEQVAENLEGDTLAWMREEARQKACVITGSVVLKEGAQYVNRLIWMCPDGTFQWYDKRHLFRYGNEQEHYQAGTEKLLVELKGWRVCPLICYDLRFPVWSRNRWKQQDNKSQAEYDLLIYVANWPERRSHPWKTLLMARAIENQAYVMGVNRIGNDGNGIYHAGDSAILDFKGELLSKPNTGLECIETAVLSANQLTEFRNSFPAGMDADAFQLG
jgi:omega-amidase